MGFCESESEATSRGRGLGRVVSRLDMHQEQGASNCVNPHEMLKYCSWVTGRI